MNVYRTPHPEILHAPLGHPGDVNPGLMKATSAHPSLANLSAPGWGIRWKKKKKKWPILRQRLLFHYYETFRVQECFSPFAYRVPHWLLKNKETNVPIILTVVGLVLAKLPGDRAPQGVPGAAPGAVCTQRPQQAP